MQPDELPPTLGVREPRKPKPSPQQGGATAPLEWTLEPEAEALAPGACVGCPS